MRRIPYLQIALGLALALVAVLGWQNHRLRADNDWLLQRASAPYYGMYVPVVEIAALDGERLRLGAPEGGFQILYFFDAHCPYCLESAPMVRELARRAAGLGGTVRMIGLGKGEDAEIAAYAREHGFVFPVAAMRDRRLLALYRGDSVPLAMLIGPDGRVLHAHPGPLDTMDQVGSLLAAMRTDPPPAAAPQAQESSP